MIETNNSQLTPDEKRQLLAKLLEAKGQKDSKPRIGPVSFAQRRLWFLYQLAPESTGYNVSIALRSEQELNHGALKYALREIIRRHEVLRTVFTTVSGVPMQEVRPPFDIELPVRDLSQESNPEKLVRGILKEETNQPFNLTTGPLLRGLLLRLNQKNNILLLVVHHIVYDGWSTPIFFQELDAHYRAYQEGGTAALPELPLQYIDYAVRQRNWLQSEVLEGQLNYWKHQLEGAPGTILLPLGQPRRGYSGNRRGTSPPIHLPTTLVKSLRDLASAEGVTLFVVLLGAFKALLAQYSGQKNIVVGIPVAGRSHHQVENLIGFFVNMLILHTDLSGNPGFREILQRVNKVLLGAFNHQDIPFEKLVQELNPDRDSSGMPITQVVFNYLEVASDQVWLPGMGARLYPFGTGTIRFDVETTMFGTPNGVEGFWGYDPDIFNVGTMTRMLTHYRNFLEEAVAQPDRGFLELPLLNDDERRQVLVAWNATNIKQPLECVHELFEAQVVRSSEAVAINFEEDHLSYREVEPRANQLAWRLRELGVGPEVVVGVSLMPSLDLAITLLGILKAGGTYVHLNPLYPTEWLSHMLMDLNMPLVVSHSDIVGRLPEMSPSQILLLDREIAELGNQRTEQLESKVCPENAACIIYGADFTAEPTGVIITHQMICNQLHWLQQQYRLHSQDRVLLQTPLSFSASTWEFFWPLSVGVPVILTRDGGQLDPSYLLAVIQDEQISVLHVTPTMLSSFLAEPGVEECESLRLLLCSGELLSSELEKKCRRLLPNIDLYNIYETNETGQVSNWLCMGDGRFGQMPVGRPVANSQIYILDEWMEPVPVEVTGEVYIGGVQLTPGYWQKPKITAENFIPNPYNPTVSRLYRTGDLGRYRADGILELVGRVDHLIHIEGVRLEIGQVEDVLLNYPALETAIVSDFKQAPETNYLVAYMVPNKDRRGINPQIDYSQEELATSLRSYSQTRLPPPLVPAYYILLERLPLQANGKLDRSSLPEPVSLSSTEKYILPRNEMEQIVAQIWRSVLQREEIGVHENFFDLGGHSLLVVQVMARLRNELGVDQPSNLLFRYRTVADLSARLSELITHPFSGKDSGSLIQLQSGTDVPALILVHPVGGDVSCYVPLATTLPNHAVYAFEAQVPGADITEMASHYVDELFRQLPDTSYYLGGWSMGGVIAFEMARQLTQRGNPDIPVILIDSYVFQAGEQKPFSHRDRIQAFLTNVVGSELPKLNEVDGDESDEVILSQTLEQLQSRGYLRGIDLELLMRRFEMYCSNASALAKYVPQPYIGPIYFIKALESEPSIKIWHQLSKSLTLFEMAGNHYDLLRGDNVSHVGQFLNQVLNSAKRQPIKDG